VATVELIQVSKSYGTLDVVHGIDLAIAEGEMVALVGPSGCGKSTLLRMIAGLEEITGGEIRLGGQRVNETRPRDRNVAMVFQNYALYPHMTVRQNVDLNMRIAGLPQAEIAARVARAADLLEITPLLDRKPAQLSGGQRQRVAMGRAIVRDPSVFLFDEPLSNLDAKLRVQMRSEIKALHQKVRTTSVYVTHDQIEAMTLADRVVVMNKGRIEQVGAPVALYRRPGNLFVAGFIGSPAMNLLPARTHPDGIALHGGLMIPAAVPVPGREVVFGIRPEDIRLDANGPLVAEVRQTEPTGAQTIVTAALGSQAILLIVDGTRTISPDDRLTLTFPSDRQHIFDAASGQRLDLSQETSHA
jgi:multiple sugar transport system ATP-binding protein